MVLEKIYYIVMHLEVTYSKGMAVIDLIVWSVFIFLVFSELLGYHVRLQKNKPKDEQ